MYQAQQPYEAQFTTETQTLLTLLTNLLPTDDATNIAEVQSRFEWFNIALDIAQIGVWAWDFCTGKIYSTVRCEAILGFETVTTERTFQEWLSRLHPEDVPMVQAMVQSVLASQEDCLCQCRVLSPDQTLRWIECRGRCYFDEHQRPRRLLGTISDITERKLAQQALQESEHRYAMLAGMSPVGIFRSDTQGNCLYVNDRWCEITGLDPAEAIGKGWRQALHPEDIEQVDLATQSAIEQDQPFRAEFRFQQPDGKVVWVFGQAKPERNSQGCVIGYVGTVTDITDRKQAELALWNYTQELAQVNMLLTQTTSLLKKRNDELDQFAYVVSHDLKAPLRAITNLSEWIEEDTSDLLPPENREQLQLLRQRVSRMEGLINGLLEYSRIGRTAAEPESVDVHQLLQEVVDSLAPPVEWVIVIRPEMPVFVTRRILLMQVFSNLISNAIKHHETPGGIIQIAVQEQEAHYEFAVTDDGPGIAPEHHDRIFGIFQTLQSRDRQENTGIGLAIVKRIIEAESGKIWLNSQVGIGTTFYFTWPKQPPIEANLLSDT